ncbi:glycosyltransferase family 2 protein [Aquirufa sp.]|jgi:glycosyltransferase involved in cell wall biosynthesis|uniref:glycosyltransferase family 2 protein n=1 Tax=Aquirufa sp. TaxID=2676249 RepID=UPI0037C1074C
MKDVSVIIPYFNSKETILISLESVNNQTIKPFEVIVVDDHSDVEHSAKFLEECQFDFKLIVHLHEFNQGAATARNTGISISSGYYVAFLDADDAWVENKLELQLNTMMNHNLDYLYSNYSEFYPSINVSVPKLSKVRIGDVFLKNLSPVTLIAKRSEMLFFDPRLRRCDDYKLSIEALLKEKKIGLLHFNSSYGFKKAIGESGLTGSILKMSASFIYANILLQIKYPKFFFWGCGFILFELLKFPVRFLRTRVLK